jgi:preprotein translocase subunit SecG
MVIVIVIFMVIVLVVVLVLLLGGREMSIVRFLIGNYENKTMSRCQQI